MIICSTLSTEYWENLAIEISGGRQRTRATEADKREKLTKLPHQVAGDDLLLIILLATSLPELFNLFGQK